MKKNKYKIKNIKGAFGYFWKNEIVLSGKLTNRNIPSKEFVYRHELMHKYISDNDIKVKNEETRCDVYALVNCKAVELSLMEQMYKKLLLKRFGHLNKDDIIKLKIKDLT